MRFSAATLATALAVGGLASAQSTDITYMPGIDFSRDHTYKWVAVQNRQHPDPSVDLEIKTLVDSQMATKGFVKSEDRPDLDIDYQVALSKAVPWKTYSDFQSGVVPKRETFTINKGTLVLDVYETATRKLVWSGRAERHIDAKGGAKQMRSRVEKAVEAMLSHFPPH